MSVAILYDFGRVILIGYTVFYFINASIKKYMVFFYPYHRTFFSFIALREREREKHRCERETLIC